MEQLYPSQFQPVCKATLYVARDRVNVQSRRKYVFTDQIDQLIREIYLNHRDAKTRPGIRPLAKKIGMPHWALKKRARELGLYGTERTICHPGGNHKSPYDRRRHKALGARDCPHRFRSRKDRKGWPRSSI